jgi:hypothetical protein
MEVLCETTKSLIENSQNSYRDSNIVSPECKSHFQTSLLDQLLFCFGWIVEKSGMKSQMCRANFR